MRSTNTLSEIMLSAVELWAERATVRTSGPAGYVRRTRGLRRCVCSIPKDAYARNVAVLLEMLDRGMQMVFSPCINEVMTGLIESQV